MNDQEPGWLVYIYAGHNVLAIAGKLGLYGAAIYLATQGAGGILAAVIVALLAGAIDLKSIDDDHGA